MNCQSDSKDIQRQNGDVAKAALIACLGAVATSIAINIFPELNASDTNFVWYPIPTLLVVLLVVGWIDSQYESVRSKYDIKLWTAIGALVVVGTLVGLTGTGWSHVLNGTALLPGEARFPPGLFRTTYPFVIAAAAGLVEEATIRGLFQLKVRTLIGNAYSQIVAGIIFVALHGLEAMQLGRLSLLVTTAVISGRLAARTNSVVPPAIFHASVNVSIAAAVLVLRP